MKLIGAAEFFRIAVILSVFFFSGIFSRAEAAAGITVLKMSDEAGIMRQNLGEVKKLLHLDKKDAPALIEELKKNYSLAFPKVKLKNRLTFKKYGDNPVYALKNGGKHDAAVIFIHGGAYRYNISGPYAEFCDNMVNVLNADVYMPLYSLIPYGTYKEAFQLLDSVYEDLQKNYAEIIIAGDSCGGSITLSYTLHRKEQKKSLPYKIIAISPVLDASMENPDILKYVSRDPMLEVNSLVEFSNLWRGDLEITDWRISPFYGELTGLPDILLFFGQEGILYPDGIRFYNALIKAGNESKLVIGNGMFHVFPVYNIPEQDESLQIMKEFCR